MFRSIIILSILAIATLNASAQRRQPVKNQVEIGAGVGIISTYFKDRATTVVPPLSARLDVRLNERFSLGAFATYARVSSPVLDPVSKVASTLSNQSYAFGVRAAAHITHVEKWDFYGGLALGYNMFDITHSSTDAPDSEVVPAPEGPSFHRPATNQLVYTGFVGAAYSLNKTWSVYSELGYGASILTAGLVYKL